jgi:hypothetical protein
MDLPGSAPFKQFPAPEFSHSMTEMHLIFQMDFFDLTDV